ncbi:hypothetical protein [Paenibacillus sp. HJGM_3]|uniref:hypothetical protein n=1 Tax=Paenibacillus sp. HJGM_3 TaxID=3379816 RepID=UPI00386005B7
MLSTDQKKLILAVLRKEKGRLLSRFKGKTLDKTIDDLAQMLRNEVINDRDPNKSIEWKREKPDKRNKRK